MTLEVIGCCEKCYHKYCIVLYDNITIVLGDEFINSSKRAI